MSQFFGIKMKTSHGWQSAKQSKPWHLHIFDVFCFNYYKTWKLYLSGVLLVMLCTRYWICSDRKYPIALSSKCGASKCTQKCQHNHNTWSFSFATASLAFCISSCFWCSSLACSISRAWSLSVWLFSRRCLISATYDGNLN